MLKIILGLTILLSSWAALAQKRILVLHSYDIAYTWTSTMQEGIMEGFKDLPPGYDVYYQFMDARRFGSDQYFEKLKNWYITKFQGLKFDYVLTVDDDAYNFFMKYYPELFPDADLCFSGKGSFDSSVLRTFPHKIYGVMSFVDMMGNLNLIRQIHGFKKVYYLIDASTTGVVQYEKWLKVFSAQAPEVEIIPLDMREYTNEEILEKISKLSNSALLMNVIGRDKNGDVVDHLEMTKRITNVSHIPIYAESSMRLGTGIVGGKLADGKNHGRYAARKLVRVLKGDADSVSVVETDTHNYMFDHAALQKFGISQSKLPKGSIIIGKPLAFYSQYKKYMLLMACGLAALFILVLIQTNRIRLRRKFQLRLQELVHLRTSELNIQIEEQKKLRKTLISKEKLASLGSLTAGIAHEIKNPLNIILNSAIAIENRLKALSSDDSKAVDDIKRMLNFIIKNSYRADSIIQNMLGQAKNAESVAVEVNLNKLLDEAIALVYHASRTKFPMNVEIVKTLTEIPPVIGTKESLLRAFINLMENSFYALYKKQLMVSYFSPKIELKTYMRDKKSVVIEIRDNGIGISTEILDKIQLPFFTTKPAGEGTGLGLSMVSDIVSAHGGELEISAVEGEYTLIKIIVPTEVNIV